jgi:hypothetical protein
MKTDAYHQNLKVTKGIAVVTLRFLNGITPFGTALIAFLNPGSWRVAMQPRYCASSILM